MTFFFFFFLNKKVWEVKCEAPIYSSPCVSNELNMIIFGCHDGHLYMINFEEIEIKSKDQNQTAITRFEIGSGIYSSPFLALLPSNNENRDGNESKRKEFFIATTSMDGKVVLLKAIVNNDSRPMVSIIASKTFSAPIFSSPIVLSVDSKFFITVGCRDDNLYLLSLEPNK